MDDEGTRVKRFKHQSYNQTLKDVHLPSALAQSQFDHEIGDSDSHFHESLEHWRQLNLAPSFLLFAQRADPLSASIPLLLHNWGEIVELWVGALKSADDEGLRALLDLLQKLTHDLRTTLSPVYSDLLDHLLGLLPRAISAPALTALLATLSSLFKYLLVPSTSLQLLENSWLAIRNIISKCLPEVRRATAEVWGSVLRRLKPIAREHAVTLIANDVESMEDTSAWIFVFAGKSVSQTLHTTTVSIMTPLLAHHLTCKNPDVTHTLIRRVLTAFIHHVKNADQFSALADVLVQQFCAAAKSNDADVEQERFRRMLEVMSVPCSVRQGSRMSQKQLSLLLAECSLRPITEALQSALLKFITTVLTAGDMALWMGLGRKFLERSWEHPIFAIKVHGALAELGWGGWKSIALPTVLKMTSRLLEMEPRRTIGLLAALHREKKLGDVDLVWRLRVETWVTGQLVNWERSQESAIELEDILTLSNFLSSISPLLVQIVEMTLGSTEPSPDCEESFAGSAWVLGSCMEGLANRDSTEWINLIDLRSWARACVEKWGWSASVLGGLVSLSRASSSDGELLALDELYPFLRDSILSHFQPLRLNVLRLLSSSLVKSSPGAGDVLKRCLQGEEVSLDIQGVRERVLRIGRVSHVVREEEDIGADICARWLTAQLKVNLRPLWSPATGALASLSHRFGNHVWRLLFLELQALSLRQSENSPHGLADTKTLGDNSDDPWEEERSWRDPSAHKIRSVITTWLDGFHKSDQALKNPNQRFDCKSYELQLLSALGECSSLAEKHSRELVPLFLSLADPNTASKLSRHRLSSWLALFAKFSNPKALYSTDALHSLFISFLSHPDRSLQSLALSCIFIYKSPHLSPYQDQIRILLDDTRWRDELSSLDLGKIEPQHRIEVMNVIIRLLFGLMLEKRGRSHGVDRRAAILATLAGCTDVELGLLVDLMLRPFGSDRASRQGEQFVLRVVPEESSEKQQTGYLTLLGDVLKNLGPRLVSYWPALLGTTIDLIGGAQARIEAAHHAGSVVEEVDIPADDVEDADGEISSSSSRTTRSVRQLGLKRFADFFRCPAPFDFTPYMSESFASFISPRLSSLDKENTQAPSALLELFYVWTLLGDHVKFLVDHDGRVLPKVYDCLVAMNVKPVVVSRIFDIIDRLLAFSTVDDVIAETIVKPHMSLLLTNLAILTERMKGVASVATPLFQRQISILSEVAQYSTDASQASALFDLFAPLLRKPSKLVPENVKVDLLKILGNLMGLIPDLSDRNNDVYAKTYTLFSQLFQILRSRPSRLGLVSAFRCFALIDTPLQTLVDLLESLNAYSTRRLEEPDFDRRLVAFANLNGTLYKTLSEREWLPLLYNMLHFIQDPAELAVRNNASFALRHFVDLVATTAATQYEATFTRILYPGLKHGLRSKNEMVRAEVLGVIAYAVAQCNRISLLQEMQPLLAGGDEEANFFNNIHHVQIHRRSRALRRLADQSDEGHLRSNTLAEIFIPLIGNYIITTSAVDHHLVNDAILTTGRLAKHVAWGPYYALVQKYLRLSREKDQSERVYIRTLVVLLDNFHFPMEEILPEVEKTEQDNPDVGVEDDDNDGHKENDLSGIPSTVPLPTASRNSARIADAVNLRLLPNLLHHLEKRDSTSEDSTRIPIAIGIVKVAKHLPAATREPQITRLITVLAQILRSRSQETRDLTRDTLARIAVSLGSSYLPLILQEMRGALLRGPHLHVLAYVTHALLVHVTSGEEAFETLDECVSDVAYISAEVVFGESGKDVQAEEFKTKMREVRSSSAKGLDSFTVMAKHITPPKISSLLVPLRSIMQETESIKVMQVVEEVLRRVVSGLNANKHLVPAELLVLCHTLISQNARFLKQAPPRRRGNPKGDAIVQMKRQVAIEVDHFTNNSFRFVAFGLDLFNTGLRRNRFDFSDPSIIARLESMVVVVGNTLYSSSTPVLVLGLKCAAAIVKCPLRSLESSLPVLVGQIIDIIKQAGNTESEVVQMAFKSLANILRDGPAVQVKEKDLVYILELLSPDLEEPSRQASVFTMLRAIVSRKFVVPEIYDLMDKVSDIMVTSQSPQVQELCRGVLLQFLLDYPQGKGRLRNQMAFLAKNLSYVYETGRKSVMELLGAVVAKFEVGLVREYADLLFVALVMVIANDDSAKCREMAAQLIKSLFTRLDDNRRRIILSHLHSWSSQHSHPQLTRVSSQVYGLIIDILQLDALSYVPAVLDDLNAALERSSQQLELFEEGDSMDADIEWQVPYHAMIVLSKILRVFPDLTTQNANIVWKSITAHLLFPHAWVRTASCRLMGLLFAAVPVSPPRSDLSDDSPLSRTNMQEVAKKLCLQLKSEHLDEALSFQVVKNLFYIGKCFYTIPLPSLTDSDVVDNEADEVFDEEDGGVEEGRKDKDLNPLPWLFSKLSYQVRSAHIARRNRTSRISNWSHQPLSVVRWFAAMTSHMEAERLEKFLVHILTPVYRITDDDTIRDPQMDELKTLAVELQDLVQSKVGTTKFSNTYNQIRQSVLGVRRERKDARVMQMTTNPEAAAKRKVQRNSIKKDSRKRKHKEFADSKGRLKKRREE